MVAYMIQYMVLPSDIPTQLRNYKNTIAYYHVLKYHCMVTFSTVLLFYSMVQYYKAPTFNLILALFMNTNAMSERYWLTLK